MCTTGGRCPVAAARASARCAAKRLLPAPLGPSTATSRVRPSRAGAASTCPASCSYVSTRRHPPVSSRMIAASHPGGGAGAARRAAGCPRVASAGGCGRHGGQQRRFRREPAYAGGRGVRAYPSSPLRSALPARGRRLPEGRNVGRRRRPPRRASRRRRRGSRAGPLSSSRRRGGRRPVVAGLGLVLRVLAQLVVMPSGIGCGPLVAGPAPPCPRQRSRTRRRRRPLRGPEPGPPSPRRWPRRAPGSRPRRPRRCWSSGGPVAHEAGPAAGRS